MTESMSYFLKTLLTASMSVKSTFSKGTLFPTMASILRSASVEELRRLSRMTTLYPASITSTVYATLSLSKSKRNVCFGGRGVFTVCEPMYPVPPVRRTYLPFLAADDILQFSVETVATSFVDRRAVVGNRMSRIVTYLNKESHYSSTLPLTFND